jgi:transcriptional regulator with XRE-family HTH domain
MKFSDTLKYLRKRAGLSQLELSEKIGVKKSTISMYEQDARKPSYEVLEALADFFNVDMDYLTGKSDIERKYEFDPHKEKVNLSSYLDTLTDAELLDLLQMLTAKLAERRNEK